MSACTVVGYTSPAGTVQVSALTKQIFTVTNRLLRLDKYGGEEENMTCTQGGWRPWTSYSGPTHRQDAEDLTPWNWRNRFYWLDLLGHVPFHRTPDQGGWVEHIHTLCNGLSCVDPYAKGQIAECKNGGDGLKGSKPDPDAKLRSGLWPLAIYQGRTGILTAMQATQVYDGPASTRRVVATVPKGTKTNAIMEVRNRFGNVWFVTDKGNWGLASKWTK